MSAGVRRIGIVGAGPMGRLHARAVARRAAARGDVELAWVVDRHAARGDAVARQHGGRAAVGLEEVLADLDAVAVAVPTAGHVDVVERLFAVGLDVLVEKPMAPTAQAARALADGACRARCTLAVGHSEWFHPGVALARAQVTHARRIEIVREAPPSARGLDLDVVQDLMLHDLDWLARASGGVPRVRAASGRRAVRPAPGHAGRGGHVDVADTIGRADDPAYVDEAVVELELAGGGLATLRASRVAGGRRRVVRIEGAGAETTIDLDAVVAQQGGGRFEPLDLAWDDFLSACAEGHAPVNDADAGVAVADLVETVHHRLRASGGC